MIDSAPTSYSPLARWSRGIGLFSVQLLLVVILLHRLLSLPTPVALNIFAAVLAGACLAIMLALASYVAIWRDGRFGFWSASAGLLLGLGILAWPAVLVPFYRSLPPIHDVTTDLSAPPAFVTLAAMRDAGANRPEYAGAAVAQRQQDAYADIRPVVVARPVNETWEVLGETIKRLGWKVASETPPAGRGKPGYIEAVDRTLVLGFYDDVVVRVTGDQRETRVDVRSASRYGEHDFGRNAQRIRRLFKELAYRLDETVGGGERAQRRRALPNKAVPKRGRGDALAAQKASGRAATRSSNQPPADRNRRRQQQ